MFLTDDDLRALQRTANTIRQDVIEMLVAAGSGHSAGPLGMADVFTALYWKVLRHDPQRPQWPDRDRLVLSNGHICPVLYATLAEAGYFPVDELATLRKLGSRLQGHPHRGTLPGIETSSGPLGSGLSQACGMALVAKREGLRWRTYCLTSDGEHDEGNTWEAVMFAAKYRLHNLTEILDRNNIQIDGFTEDVMPLDSIRAKYEAFNWHVLEIDGHNYEQIVAACEEAKAIFEKPTLIIAHTIPGRGVDFMEQRFEWHGNPPDAANVPGAPPKGQQAAVALAELRTLRGRIESEHQ
ncbi:MAG TPA: transketolase [Chloroflexota bacterium]|nr:transketolase [Chloroflexota bacterium]